MTEISPDQRIVRKDGVRLREIEGAGFLADSETQGIFHLNEIGVAIWRLLESPVSSAEITELLCQAFPDTGRPQIEADVTALVARLTDKELILVAE